MLPEGSRVGDYEVEGELGAGGMATVYRARHVVLGSRVAIKVLDPRFRTNAVARRRFLDEARIQHTHLDHPNIVKVTGIVATDEHAALVMELIEGSSLEGEVPRLAGQADAIRRIMSGVLAGVGHAHAAGIIHRDLKPANVLLKRRTGGVIPKVTDFGIAKLSAELSAPGKKSTHGDSRMGTLNYMSPEQIKRAKDVTPRSDIFSLGAMLYELATGELPFDGDNDYDVMDAILHGNYVDPEERNPYLDPTIAAVIRQALATDPERRFARCEAMAAALGTVSARPRSPTPPVPLVPVEAPSPTIDDEAHTLLHERPVELVALPAARPPRASRAGLVAAAALGLAAVGVALVVHRRGDGAGNTASADDSRQPSPAPAAPAPRVGAISPIPACPTGMVGVSAGTFWMGSVEGIGTRDEHPRHLVTLSAFCIDRTEVTVAAYGACGACSVAGSELDGACNLNWADRGEHPVNCVSWLDADGFCRANGMRLPTEAEWELAAGGFRSRTYPWGDGDPTSNRLNMRGTDDGYDQTSPVGAYPAGAGPFGTLDMAGDVFEWVADQSMPYDPAPVTDPLPVTTPGPTTDKAYVVRGGSWKSSKPSDFRVARRAYFKASVGGIGTGFRCARDAR